MKLRILDLCIDERAFLIDEETGKRYYKHLMGHKIVEDKRTPPLERKINFDPDFSGGARWWFDKEALGAITFDSLEDVDYYISHAAQVGRTKAFETYHKIAPKTTEMILRKVIASRSTIVN